MSGPGEGTSESTSRFGALSYFALLFAVFRLGGVALLYFRLLPMTETLRKMNVISLPLVLVFTGFALWVVRRTEQRILALLVIGIGALDFVLVTFVSYSTHPWAALVAVVGWLAVAIIAVQQLVRCRYAE